MDMKLELVPIPVTDVDQAKSFYTDKVGFVLDVDVQPTEGMRVVQLTPPGSACSVVIGTGLNDISDMTPGSQKGLHLVVPDISQARDELICRGVSVGEVVDVGGGVKYAVVRRPRRQHHGAAGNGLENWRKLRGVLGVLDRWVRRYGGVQAISEHLGGRQGSSSR